MTRALLLACVLATLACGRIGYDAQRSSGSAGSGGDGGSAGTSGSAGTIGGAGTIGAAGTTGAGGWGGGAAGSSGPPDGGFTCTTMTYAGHEYHFCEDAVDWPTARAACEARGARLVRIDDLAENTWLAAAAGAAPGNVRLEVWIGAYEPTVDGDWRWTDGDAFWLGASNGAAVAGRYANWGRSEPNNEVDPEACAVIQLNSAGWYDFQCSTRESFICEVY